MMTILSKPLTEQKTTGKLAALGWRKIVPTRQEIKSEWRKPQ